MALDGPAAIPEQERAVPQRDDDPALTVDLDGPGPQRPAEGDPPYRLGPELGRGGIGRVVSAWDSRLGREVALKELLPMAGHSTGGGAPGLGRFLAEARVTARLEHPNIVPVYGMGVDPAGAPYYTMRKVRGRSLQEAIAAAEGLRGRLALLPHVVDACQALAYAHSEGVVHRDIKPANIMVGGFGETVVLDWGLAKVLGEPDRRGELLAPSVHGDTVDGAVLGSPGYMPPEQARGQLQDIDQRSDVWALGALLYTLLTGAAPYTGLSATDVLRKAAEGEPRPISAWEPSAPPELAAIARRALQVERAQRYPDARALAADIQRWMEGRQVSAYDYRWWERLAALARRHRPMLALASLALLGLGLMGLWSVQRIRHERDQAVDAEQRALRSLTLVSAERARSLVRAGHPMEGALTSAAALQALEDPDLRGALIQADGAPLPRFEQSWVVDPPCFAIAAGEGRALCGSMDGVHLWGPAGPAWTKTGGGRIRAVAWAGEGRFVTGDEAGELVLWEGTPPQALRRWQVCGTAIRTIQASAGGEELLAGCYGGTRWSWSQGQEQRREQASAVVLASATRGGLRAWGGASTQSLEVEGKRFATPPPDNLHATYALDISPSLGWLAAGVANGDLLLMPLGEGRPLQLDGHQGALVALAWLDEGRLVTAGADGTLRFWDLSAEAEIGRGRQALVGLSGLALDGDQLWVSAQDGEVVRWDVRAPRERFRVEGVLDGWSLAAGADRVGVLVRQGEGLERWRLLDFSAADGLPLASWPLLDRELWEPRFDGQEVWVLSPAPLRYDPRGGALHMLRPLSTSDASRVTADRAGDQVALLGYDGQLELRRISDDSTICTTQLQVRPASQREESQAGLWWVRGGRELVDAGAFGQVTWRDPRSCAALEEGQLPAGLWRSMVPHPTQRTLYYATDEGGLWRWSPGQGPEQLQGVGSALQQLLIAEEDLLVGLSTRGGVHVWELAQGRRLASFGAHSGRILSAALRGTSLYTASFDQAVRRWDLRLARSSPAAEQERWERQSGLRLEDGQLRR